MPAATDPGAGTGPGLCPRAGLRRLLNPAHIAVYGGDAAAEAVRQCRAVGYTGEIWPVHPRRDSVEGLPCHRGTASLPAPPDAAFVAVPGAATVDVVAELAAYGAGGAVCHASGFAEDGPEGARLQRELRTAARGMPVVGPNCIGVLNYLDGSALWADQHGGGRVDSGVAVVTQSGNIGQNLTMQRRSLPLAYVVTAGNSAVTGVPELVEGLLEDPRVTAIGLHLEGIADPAAFSRAALAALRRRVPLVVLKTGTSELGARANLSHTSSLAGSDVLCDALFRRLGIARVDEVSTFVETLKLLHVHGPLDGKRIVSASCSGGEAALVADTAQRYGAELPALPGSTAVRLREVLGPRVRVANPLDYHTAIWGDEASQRACFTALLGAEADVGVLLLDVPREDRCESDAWTAARVAFVAAQRTTGARACVVSSLPEGVPEDAGHALLAAGVAPMQGMADCVRAVVAAARIGAAQRACAADGALLIDAPEAPGQDGQHGIDTVLDERAGKCELAAAGVAVPDGAVAAGPDEAAAAAVRLGFPVVAKALSPALAHKTEAGGVRLGLDSEDAVRGAVGQMARAGLADRFLVEQMVPDAVTELLVGVRHDAQFGRALTVGAGGVLVELVRDSATLLLPAGPGDIEEALRSLRLWPVLAGYRGRAPGDVRAAVASVHAVAEHARRERVTELDVNPLLVLPEGRGAVAADVLIRRRQA